MKWLHSVLIVAVVILSVVVLSGADVLAQSSAMDCPDEVEPGQVFLLTVFRKGGADTIKVEFQGDRYFPQTVDVEGGTLARVILGVGLNPKHDILFLRVDLDKGNEPEFLEKTIHVKKKEFPEERLTVSEKYVNPDEAQLKRIKEEQTLVRNSRSITTASRVWKCPFVRPVPGPVSSVFGLRRFFNGEERSPHMGVDLKAAAGEEVRAVFDGRVQLAGDFYFGGNCIYLDHGQGVLSSYAHLSEIKVKHNQEVKAGDVIGLAGSTGRVTGPHLHLGLSIYGDMVDPLWLLDGICPKKE